MPVPSLLPRLPRLISHFLGHRPPPYQPPPNSLTRRLLHNLLTTFGVFLSILALTSLTSSGLGGLSGPPHSGVILAAFGASSILLFATPHSPLTQPPSLLIGDLLSALCGILTTKLLHEYLRLPLPITCAVSCAFAAMMMDVTGTTYPPGGATALLAVADPGVRGLGWRLLGVVGVGVCVLGGVGLVVVNLVERWPLWWVFRDESERRVIGGLDVEKGDGGSSSSLSPSDGGGKEKRVVVGPVRESSGSIEIRVSSGEIVFPRNFVFGKGEEKVLVQLAERLRGWKGDREAVGESGVTTRNGSSERISDGASEVWSAKSDDEC
ncbi:hypothetical protein FGG08_001429 [Glutinoglossum americanum]|uniref:HPP transmembrane region domain-containing protein n=1 Tax=Glutinoglossum americanum TaxID=1670608 RepID=A0A9P8IGT7_9PEZI|nr:hypothetical protein FGG08_001429 [Glutinoglossum americanum]